MRLVFYVALIIITIQGSFVCQNFNVSKTSLQTFYFNDPQNRNQLLFTSETELENFSGITTDVWGEISFDPADVEHTLKGKISTSANSLNTGIEGRDEELYSSGWLETEKYPTISITIKEVMDVIKLEDNKIKLTVIGQFDCHGVKKDIISITTLTYLEESSLTQKRLPGDLLSVVGEFNINLSDFGIQNAFIPKRVSNQIKITINIVGTNKKPE